MDRLTQVLRPRLVVPVVGVVLAGLVWLLPRTGVVAPGEPSGPEAAVPLAAREELAGAVSAPPQVLAAAAPLRPLATALPCARQVQPAAFPDDGEAPAVRLGGPQLVIRGPVGSDEAGTSGPAASAPVEGKLMAPSEIRLRLPASFEPKPAVPAPNELPLPITPFTGSLLTPDDGTAARSEQLEAIAQQADRQICHGYELANRGALFAARGEFVAALRLVAQGLDSERQTSIHSRALSAGLTALREVQDFLPAGSKVEAELDLPTIIVSHRTPVLKGGAEDVRPLAALRCYFTFAQEQLAAAEGREVAGSIALCALGKLHAALARQKRLEIQAPEPKAVAYFQAALLVCPRNSLASHELGVLLAQCGNPANARPMLEHSVGLCRTATGLRNLAVVYQQLGLARQASETLQQSELARQAETARMKALRTSADGMVQWVDQDLLARSGSLPADLPPPGAKPNPSAPAANTAASPKKPIVGWLPWSQEKR